MLPALQTCPRIRPLLLSSFLLIPPPRNLLTADADFSNESLLEATSPSKCLRAMTMAQQVARHNTDLFHKQTSAGPHQATAFFVPWKESTASPLKSLQPPTRSGSPKAGLFGGSRAPVTCTSLSILVMTRAEPSQTLNQSRGVVSETLYLHRRIRLDSGRFCSAYLVHVLIYFSPPDHTERPASLHLRAPAESQLFAQAVVALPLP